MGMVVLLNWEVGCDFCKKARSSTNKVRQGKLLACAGAREAFATSGMDGDETVTTIGYDRTINRGERNKNEIRDN